MIDRVNTDYWVFSRSFSVIARIFSKWEHNEKPAHVVTEIKALCIPEGDEAKGEALSR